MTILEEMRTERRHWEVVHREQLARFEQRFDQLERRFDGLETRMGALEARMGALEARMGALEVRLGDVKSDLMKWSFVFWVGAVTAIAALAGVLR